jgi:hypothetical protein
MAGAEARALLKVAQASMSNPDLLNPRGIVEEAVILAPGNPDIAAEAESLLAAIRARSGTQAGA